MEFQTGELPTLKGLIIAGRVSPGTQDSYGQSILFYAVQRTSDIESAELTSLILGASSPEVARFTDHIQQTALFYAAKAGNLATARLLVAAGCRADAKDRYGQVPLFYAARDGHTHVAAAPEFLCTADIVDLTGQTSLFYAAREGHRDICELLLSQSPHQIHHRDVEGRRASYFARSRGFTDLADLLDSQPEVEDSQRRQRCRLVSLDGSLAEEQLAMFEKDYPEIAVWLAREGPMSRKPAISAKIQPRSPPQISKKKSAGSVVMSEWENAARRVLSDLGRRADADIFMRPVDPVKHMCPDYPLVITKPMDFGTISSRLKSNAYSGNYQLFKADVELVFSNCHTYNAEGTLPRLLCKRTEDWLLPRLERLESTAPALATTPLSEVSFK